MMMSIRVVTLLCCVLGGSCTTAPHIGILAGEGTVRVDNVVRSRNKPRAAREEVEAKLPADVAAAEAELEELLNLTPKKAMPEESKLRPRKSELVDVVRRPAAKQPASQMQEAAFRRLPRFEAVAAAEQAPAAQKKDTGAVDIMDQLVVRTRKATPHAALASAQKEEAAAPAKPTEKKKQQDISLLELNHDGELKEASVHQSEEGLPKETASGDLFVVRNPKRAGRAARAGSGQQQQIRTVASSTTGQHDVVRTKRGGK